jgi:hypothetical protein
MIETTNINAIWEKLTTLCHANNVLKYARNRHVTSF